MAKHIPDAAEITIANRVAEIARVLDLIENFAESHGVASSVLTAVAVSVDELLSNTIRYGYRERKGGRITIALRVESDKLCARIEDDGNRFDPCLAAPTSPPSPRAFVGGYGLALVRALVDELAYSRDGALNITTLCKGP